MIGLDSVAWLAARQEVVARQSINIFIEERVGTNEVDKFFLLWNVFVNGGYASCVKRYQYWLYWWPVLLRYA